MVIDVIDVDLVETVDWNGKIESVKFLQFFFYFLFMFEYQTDFIVEIVELEQLN